MASQKPIVASDLPSIREILNENNAVLCRPGDPADLAEKIKIAGDSLFAQKISAQARLDVIRYTWRERAAKIIRFIS